MIKGKKKVIDAKVISNIKKAQNFYLIELEAPHIAKEFLPGQFVQIKTQQKETFDPLLRIPLGIHKRVGETRLQLLYKVVGIATTLLSLIQKGDTVNILGPLGNGFSLDEFFKTKFSKAIIVAGGHGIAPLYALAETILKRRREVEFFIGARTKTHVLCSQELRRVGAKVHIATEDGKLGYKGYVTELVAKYLQRSTIHDSQSTIYACGPQPMQAALAKMASKYKIPAQVSLDAYMACGIGVCLGCPIETKSGYKLVCKDGPVFDGEEVVWSKPAESRDRSTVAA